MKKPFYFLHIQKTAGTAVTLYLRDQFQEQEIQYEAFWHALLSYKKSDLETKSLFTGHFDRGLSRYLDVSLNTITFLRDPVNRYLSDYFYTRETTSPMGDIFPVRAAKSMDLEEFVSNTEVNGHFANVQVKSLAGDLNHPGFILTHPKEYLSLATDFINSIEFFGITEYMQESVDLLAYTFSWLPSASIRKANPTKNRKTLSELKDSVNKQLKEVNADDIALYNQSIPTFEKRFKTMLENLVKESSDKTSDIKKIASYLDHWELNSLKYAEVRDSVFNLLTERSLKTKNLEKEFNTENYTFDQHFCGTNFFGREKIVDAGVLCQRWTGPEKTSKILLQNNKKSYSKITLRQRGRYADNSILSIIINGVTYDDFIQTPFGAFTLYELYFKEPINTDESKELIEVVINTDEPKAPCDLNKEAKDTRKLGIVLDWVSLI